MTDRKPEGTFSRLMSTPRAPEQVVEEQPKATPAAEEASDERVQARTHAPKRSRTDAPSTNTNSRGAKVNVDALYRQLQAKQHLASSTFRFRPEELDELDQ